MSTPITPTSGAAPVTRREPLVRFRDNPLLTAQARRRLRLRQTLPGALVVAVLGLCGLLFAAIEHDRSAWRGLQIFSLVLGAAALYLRGTMRIAGIAAEERLGGLLDFHRATPTTPWSDALGYLLGVPAREYLLFAITVPFFVLGTVAAGDPLLSHIAALAVLLLSGLLFHALALVAGLAMERRWSASGLAILLVISMLGGWAFFVESGLTAFAYLTPFPALGELFGAASALQRAVGGVVFFGLDLPATVFTVLVQGYLLAFLMIAAARRVGRDDAPLLSRPATFAFLAIGLGLLVGSAWGHPGGSAELSLGDVAPVGLIYLGVAGVAATILQVSLVPTWLDFARAHRRARKAGRRAAPWLAEGATAAPIPLVLGGIVLAGLVLLSVTAPARVSGRLSLGLWPLVAVATAVAFAFFAGGAAEWVRLRWRKSWRGVAFLIGFLSLVLPWILAGIFMAGSRSDAIFQWIAGLSPFYGAGYALVMAGDEWANGFVRGGAPLGPYVLSMGTMVALAVAFHLLAANVRRQASDPEPSPR